MEKENLSTNIKVSSDNKAGWEHKFLLKMIVFLLILLPLPSSRRMTATERKVNSRVSSHYQFLPFFLFALSRGAFVSFASEPSPLSRPSTLSIFCFLFATKTFHSRSLITRWILIFSLRRGFITMEIEFFYFLSWLYCIESGIRL